MCVCVCVWYACRIHSSKTSKTLVSENCVKYHVGSVGMCVYMCMRVHPHAETQYINSIKCDSINPNEWESVTYSKHSISVSLYYTHSDGSLHNPSNAHVNHNMAR